MNFSATPPAGGPGGVRGPGGFTPKRTPSPEEKASAENVQRVIDEPAPNVERAPTRFEMVSQQPFKADWKKMNQEVSKKNPDSKSTQKDIAKTAGKAFKGIGAFAKAVKGG